MKINATVKIGMSQMTIQIDEQKDKEALNKAIVLTNPPTYCDLCKNKNPDHFKWDSNKDKEGNIYVNIVCTHEGCYAKAKMGEYKTGGFFWHKFEKYVKPGAEQNKRQPTEDVPPDGFPQGGGQEDSHLPF